MDQQQTIADYERRAKDAKLTIAELCKAAKLHPTTFSRWKRSERNPKPVGMTFASMSAIEAVLREHEASAERQESTQEPARAA